MGRDYRFVAIEGRGDFTAAMLEHLDYPFAPGVETRTLGAGEHPIPGYPHLMSTPWSRGTLFDLRNLSYRFGSEELAERVVALSRELDARILCTEDLSTVIQDQIILARAGARVRHVFESEFQPCFAVGPPLLTSPRSPRSRKYRDRPSRHSSRSGSEATRSR